MKRVAVGASLQNAALDLRYLLGRGYPREKVLSLVGDRHGLDRMDRRALRRGIFAPQEARARKARLGNIGDLADESLAVDGHNLLITLETALAGGRLVLADDGAIRDLGEVGRNHRPGQATAKAAAWLLAALQEAKLARVDIWLDAPLPQSGDLAANLAAGLLELGLAGQASAVPVPEREMKGHAGLVASSDSALLDQVARPLDLAGQLIAAARPHLSVEIFE